jgi:SAM-dependent methyltransferase
MQDRLIHTRDDVLDLLDEVLAEADGTWDGSWWDGFFTNRAKPIPFFVDRPDENLLEWFDRGLLTAGRVLELGCGHGRNAIFLAGRGCTVEAVDFSAEAIGWAREQAGKAGVDVDFRQSDIFALDVEPGAYDLVYDSGCFHHLAPHRRPAYVDLVRQALRPGGQLAQVCFRPEGGSGLSDRQVYERRSLGGGLGYSEDDLRALWSTAPFAVQELRPMIKHDGAGPAFGEDFLSVLLVRKTGPA